MLVEKRRIPKFRSIVIGMMPSPIKKFIYKMKGYNIGSDVHLCLGSIIVGEEVIIGNNTTISYGSIILCKKIQIGKNVSIGAFTFFDTQELTIGDNTIIREQVYVGGMTTPKSILRNGNNVKIFQFTVLNTTDILTIGDNVGIGGRCSIFTHGSWQSILEGYPVQFSPVTIKKNAWLPWHVFVMPGVVIGEGATIGANSLVNKDIPNFALAVGMPAKVIKKPPNYPLKISQNNQRKILITIIKDFIDYLNYFNICTKETSTKAVTIITITMTYRKVFAEVKRNRKILCILDSIKTITDINQYEVIITFPLISKKMREMILKNRISLYDMEFKIFHGKQTDLTNEIDSFFSRYGIRFKQQISD